MKIEADDLMEEINLIGYDLKLCKPKTSALAAKCSINLTKINFSWNRKKSLSILTMETRLPPSNIYVFLAIILISLESMKNGKNKLKKI